MSSITVHPFLHVINGLLIKCHMSSDLLVLFSMSSGGCLFCSPCHREATHPVLHVTRGMLVHSLIQFYMSSWGCSSSPTRHRVVHSSSISSSLLYQTSSLAKVVYSKSTKWFWKVLWAESDKVSESMWYHCNSNQFIFHICYFALKLELFNNPGNEFQNI